MKIRFHALTALFALLFLASAALAGSGLKPGDGAVMTEVTMPAVAGGEISISDAMGQKGTLVYFTCNHCPYVKAWQGRVVPFGNKLMERGIGVIAINSNDVNAYPSDDMDGMKARAEETGMSYPYAMDTTSDVARAYGATRTPEFFLFNPEGILIYHGAFDDDAQNPDEVEHHYLADAVEALLQGTEVKKAETKSVGCSIKFRD